MPIMAVIIAQEDELKRTGNSSKALAAIARYKRLTLKLMI